MQVGAHYDGSKIVLDEKVALQAGQRLTIVIADAPSVAGLDLAKYMGRGEKLFPCKDAVDVVRELRNGDRL